MNVNFKLTCVFTSAPGSLLYTSKEAVDFSANDTLKLLKS